MKSARCVRWSVEADMKKPEVQAVVPGVVEI